MFKYLADAVRSFRKRATHGARRRHFFLEQLESRQLMSADLHASLVGTALRIDGTDAPYSIVIREDAGVISVDGLSERWQLPGVIIVHSRNVHAVLPVASTVRRDVEEEIV